MTAVTAVTSIAAGVIVQGFMSASRLGLALDGAFCLSGIAITDFILTLKIDLSLLSAIRVVQIDPLRKSFQVSLFDNILWYRLYDARKVLPKLVLAKVHYNRQQ